MARRRGREAEAARGRRGGRGGGQGGAPSPARACCCGAQQPRQPPPKNSRADFLHARGRREKKERKLGWVGSVVPQRARRAARRALLAHPGQSSPASPRRCPSPGFAQRSRSRAGKRNGQSCRADRLARAGSGAWMTSRKWSCCRPCPTRSPTRSSPASRPRSAMPRRRPTKSPRSYGSWRAMA